MSAPDRLVPWAVFGAVLSAAGLPIYLFAPAQYAQTYGLSLTTLGLVLFGLRLFDVVQDPVLGWLAERLGAARGLAVALAGGVLALSMLGLFAVTPPMAPLLWFALTLTGLFTSFSFLTVVFYAIGIARAETLPGGHVRLAAWRESGSLVGICLAAVAPTLLLGLTDRPFAAFAWGFAAATVAALILMAPEWRRQPAAPQPPAPLRAILADPLARRLLMMALVNAAPLAISSTLFVFFVQARLDAAGWEGPLLVAFFLAAALSAPGWSRVARRFGPRPVLLAAMGLAIGVFGWALTLGAGDTTAFVAICLLSGATIGADLTLLPAMFAQRLSQIAPNGGAGFGLWSFMNKATLALAAGSLLPLIELAGFTAGAATQPDGALRLLTFLYAGLPCLLKCAAIALLAATRTEPLPDPLRG